MIKETVTKSHKYDVSYFVSNQIVFLITGDVNETSTQALLGWANKIAKKGRRKAEISINLENVLRFPPPFLESKYTQQRANIQEEPARPKRIAQPRVERGPFALVPANVTWKNMVEDKKKSDRQKEWEKDRDLLNLIFRLDRNRKSAPGKTLQAVSPDWLASGGSKPGGTGGPGGRPTPYDGMPDNEDHCFQFPTASSTFRQQLQDGDGVVVAILDTAPDPGNLDSIYDEWVIKEGRNHRLLRTLLDPPQNPPLNPKDRRLYIHPYSEAGKDGFQEMQVLGHEYDMTDHGLFVAGIIHSLAPKAKLHLFQVLNRYGVGSLRSIAQGLQQVVSNFYFAPEPLVVNLSLTLNIPFEKAHTKVHSNRDSLGKMILRHKPCWLLEWICMIVQMVIVRIIGRPIQLCNKPWMERQAWPAEWICDSVNMLGTHIFAAAGNDYVKDHHTHRPRASYPAAFEGVIGVGALPRIDPPPPASTRLEASSYSNLSDLPANKGIATLGGEEGENQGVLGIYVGEFPDIKEDPNTPFKPSGWAWWCGTSFATPIISGVMASLLSGMSSASIQNPVELIYRAEDRFTENIEDVLYVVQKKPGSSS